MKRSSCFILILLLPLLSFSQKVYDINCQISTGQKQVTAKGFLLLDDSGRGFIRIVTGNGAGGNTTLYDLEFKEELRKHVFYPATNDSFIFNRADVIRTMTGAGDKQFSYLNIWFKKNKASNKFELYNGAVPFKTSLAAYHTLISVLTAITPEKSATGNNLKQAAIEENSLTTSKLQTTKTLSSSYLQPFFTPAELTKAASLNAKELRQSREKNKPVFHYISISSGEKICDYDADECSNMFEAVAGSLKIPFNKIMLGGKNFHITYVINAIAELRCGPNDIVVVTYSGHGFSYGDDDQFPFPQLALWQGDAPTKDFLRENSINLEEIYNLVRAKKARLNMVLADCCNNIIKTKRWHIQPTRPGVFPPRRFYLNTRAVSNLFLETKSSYLVAATKKGELAGSHSWYGGFFTFSFLNGLLYNTGYEMPPVVVWEELFPGMQANALELSKQFSCDGQTCQQNMIYKTN